MAFRRLQSFKVKPGESLAWEAVSSPLRERREKPPEPQKGAAVVDQDGLFVLKELKVAGSIALTVKVTRGK